MRSKTYTLDGNPVAFAKSRFANKATWDDSRHLKCRWLINLENQHDNKPLFSGNIEMNVFFFFEIPYAWRDNKKYINAPCPYNPTIVKLLRLIEFIGRDVLYDNSAAITKITAQKLFAPNPRVEFTLTEMTFGKKEKKAI
jgi:hypothetical protein